MATLCVDFANQASFTKSIKSAKSELTNRLSDYENIQNRANHIYSNTDNCSQCASYVRKKRQKLQEKYDKLSNIDRQVNDFVEKVRDTDRRVASRIKDDTKSFKKRTGIGKSSKSLWQSIRGGFGDFFDWVGEGFHDICYNIKQFYEDNKYLINILVDVAKLAAAVVACIGTGGLALGLAAFAVYDSLADLTYDGIAAYQYYGKGNAAEADRISQKGGKDGFMFVGRLADNVLGTDFCEGLMGFAHTGLSLFAVCYSFGGSAKGIAEDLKLDKLKLRSPIRKSGGKLKFRSPLHGNFKLKSHFTKDKLKKAARNYFGYKKVNGKDTKSLRELKLFKKHSVELGKMLVKTPARARKILKAKYAYEGTKKVCETVVKFGKYVTGGSLNPFQDATEAVKDCYKGMVAIPSGGVS